MRNLIIESILLADLNNKKARKIEFSPGKNFLTSTHNHLGKSSILKSLYHTLGAEAIFSESWKQLGIFYCLNFSIDKQHYLITRYKEKYFRIYKNGELLEKANDVSKSFSKILSETFGFTINLVGKDPNKTYIECPPVFYYLPYYIDQENGWATKDGRSFDRLGQFDVDQRRLSYYYHLGVFDAEYNQINARKKDIEAKRNANDANLKNLEMFLQMLRMSVTDFQASFDEASLKTAIDKYRADMQNALKTLSETRNEIINLENEKIFLLQDKEVLAKYIKTPPISEKGSINVTTDNTIEQCPKCNHMFKSAFAKKLEKQYLFESIKEDFIDFTNKIADIERKLPKLNTHFIEQERKVKEIEALITDNTEAYEAYQKSQSTKKLIDFNEGKITELEFEQDHLKEELKKVNIKISQYEEKRNNAYDIFNKNFSKFCVQLKIEFTQLKPEYAPGEDINAAGAYGPRAKVAMLLAFVETKQELATDVLSFPIVIDSPNTLEQDSENLKVLMEAILTLNTGNQLIVASIHGTEIAQNIPGVNIITLKNEKEALLCADDYTLNEIEINSLFADI
jgi:hypothetical protein